MRYNTLGSTGLFVSELCFGTMTFGGEGIFSAFGSQQQAEADDLLGRAFAAGVNFVDTADAYSAGTSERITGQALENLGIPREAVVVATKVFGEVGPGPNGRGASRGHVLDAARASLDRLQLDYIDLYQVHGFDPATPIEETLRALDDLVRRGLVRYVGVSNWAAWQVAKAVGISAVRGLEQLATVQAYYTVAGRDVEREVLPMLRSEGLGLLVWSPLAGGLLSGKYRRDLERVEGTRRAAMAFPPVDLDRAYDVIDVLAEVATRRGASVAQVAIAWLLHQPGVTSVIVGAKRSEQLIDNLGAVSVSLDADDLASLDRVSGLPAEYPGWMFEIWSRSRLDQLKATRAGELSSSPA